MVFESVRLARLSPDQFELRSGEFVLGRLDKVRRGKFELTWTGQDAPIAGFASMRAARDWLRFYSGDSWPIETAAPPFESDEWKTFVADAMGKEPARRTCEERRAIADAMALWAEKP